MYIYKQDNETGRVFNARVRGRKHYLNIHVII